MNCKDKIWDNVLNKFTRNELYENKKIVTEKLSATITKLF